MPFKAEKKADIFIVKSEFNRSLIEEMYESALMEFQSFPESQKEWRLKSLWVPGAGEIPQAVQWILNSSAGSCYESSLKRAGNQTELKDQERAGGKNQTDLKAFSGAQKAREPIAGVLALGALIRGKTPHFDFLRGFLQTALWDLQKNHSIPLVFSVLMLENRSQFKDRVIRAGEGMKALLKMIRLNKRLANQKAKRN